jgi:hypothetical protein
LCSKRKTSANNHMDKGCNCGMFYYICVSSFIGRVSSITLDWTGIAQAVYRLRCGPDILGIMVWYLVGMGDFSLLQSIQTNSGIPASYSVGTRVSLFGGSEEGHDANHSCPSGNCIYKTMWRTLYVIPQIHK